MSLSTFWKPTRRVEIDIYMKSGNIIRLTGVETFKVKTSNADGRIVALEWKIKPRHPRLMDIQCEEIEAIIERVL